MLRILVQKVVWGARELGLPFERTDIGGAFGGTDTPAYRAINPNGLVPVIDDDGFVLWESNAIVRYLAAGHGVGNLGPIRSKPAPMPTAGWTGRRGNGEERAPDNAPLPVRRDQKRGEERTDR